MIIQVNIVLDRTVVVDSHCQQQQSYSGLCSRGPSYSTYLWNDSWIQTFHSFIIAELPEVMEGEATFVTDNGEGKVFHFVID